MFHEDGQTGTMTELIIAYGKSFAKAKKGMVWRGLDKSGLEKAQEGDCRDTVINILIP